MKKINLTLILIFYSFLISSINAKSNDSISNNVIKIDSLIYFDGILIDGPISAFNNKMVAKGYKLVKSEGNIFTFKGTFLNKQCEIYAIATPKTKKIAKLTLYFPEQIFWDDIKFEYLEIKRKLTKKYGEPTSDYEFFSDPYSEGDGYETQAVKKHKCTYSSFYHNYGHWSIAAQISEFMQVKLTYENDKNTDKIKSEQDEIDQDKL